MNLRAGLVHLVVGALVCLFVVSPAVFTPWGFGPDFSNHLWLVWQQGLAISDTGHPTLFLQTTDGVFEPFYGFYGGTLYATTGAFSALFGNHAYPVYVASIGAAAALAYGGMWWLGRQLGLSRWVAHLPAFVVVTAAYYLTDAYARGAWPELVAISAVPMFIAGGIRLLTGHWGAGPVALFVVGTVAMTGSHNLTLLWSLLILGPIAVAAWLAVGGSRPPLRRVASVAALAAVAVGINAWFLALDLLHSTDTQAWNDSSRFLEEDFAKFFFINNLGVVLDPLRHWPSQSTTYGLVIAAPVAAFALSVILVGLAWPQARRAGRALKALWLVLLVAMVVMVTLMVMPASWWIALGSPFTTIQYPYRLAGWLMVAVAVQLAISLRFARHLTGRRRQIAVGLGLGLLVLTIAQASAQIYSGPRLDGMVNRDFHARRAFVGGPTTPPRTFYDPHSYADSSLAIVEPPRRRVILLPAPSPGQTRLVRDVSLPPGPAPVATNIGAGPYVARVEGMEVVGRTARGGLVVKPPPGGAEKARLAVVADGGTLQTVAGTLSILCLLACAGLTLVLAVRHRPRR